jgi:hypothetical protein
MESATAHSTLDELREDLISSMVGADGKPNAAYLEASELFVTTTEQIGDRDPRVLAYAALTLAKWAIDRIPAK